MFYRMAIDGACRRNGKPDCVSAAGLYMERMNNGKVEASYIHGVAEHESTNQRGELLALIKALSILVDTCQVDDDVCIVTDSEYIFNAMTKGWPQAWESKGYVTAADEPVKNADLWRVIYKLSSMIPVDIAYYHIKGHTIPFGKVTAEKFLLDDPTGRVFSLAFEEAYEQKKEAKAENIQKAKELFLHNNGFEASDELLKDLITLNAVADAAATHFVEEADRDAQS